MSPLFRICGVLLCLLGSSPGWGAQSAHAPSIDIAFNSILVPGWVGYVQEGEFFLRSTTGEPVKVKASEKGGKLLSASLAAVGETVFSAWIEKGAQGNTLFLATVRKGDVTRVQTKQVASNIKSTLLETLTGEQGELYLLDAHLGTAPSLYLTVSRDSAQTFQRIGLDIGELDSVSRISPTVIGDRLYVLFFGSQGERRFVGALSYQIPSLEAAAPVVIAETDSVFFLRAFSGGGCARAVFKTIQDGEYSLQVATGEQGRWRSVTIEATKGLDVAGTDEYAWPDGRLMIVFSGEQKGRFKQQVYAAVSKDGGASWKVERIDGKSFGNTRSWLPRLAVSGEQVAVVWEDFRQIRAGARMRLSLDRGDTWLPNPLLVSDSNHYVLRPAVSTRDTEIYLAWNQFRTDERSAADNIFRKLTWSEAIEQANRNESTASLEQKEKLLRETVERYWDGMVAGDLRVSYDLHDPFYRARMPYDAYALQRGKIVYHRYKIENIEVIGNEAKVKSTVNYEIPRLHVLGRAESVPPRDFPIEDTWLFIDRGWYRKYVDALSGGSAIKY
jgi:hypothetical protein